MDPEFESLDSPHAVQHMRSASPIGWSNAYGAFLRQQRRTLGLSLQQAAVAIRAELGEGFIARYGGRVNRSMVSRWEHGPAEPLRDPFMVIAIARAYGLGPVELCKKALEAPMRFLDKFHK